MFSILTGDAMEAGANKAKEGAAAAADSSREAVHDADNEVEKATDGQ